TPDRCFGSFLGSRRVEALLLADGPSFDRSGARDPDADHWLCVRHPLGVDLGPVYGAGTAPRWLSDIGIECHLSGAKLTLDVGSVSPIRIINTFPSAGDGGRSCCSTCRTLKASILNTFYAATRYA